MEHSFCPFFPLTADLWATCQGRTLIYFKRSMKIIATQNCVALHVYIFEGGKGRSVSVELLAKCLNLLIVKFR